MIALIITGKLGEAYEGLKITSEVEIVYIAKKAVCGMTGSVCISLQYVGLKRDHANYVGTHCSQRGRGSCGN